MTKPLILVAFLLSSSACIAAPAIEAPREVQSVPACILSQWPAISQLATHESQRIAQGEVAPLEHGLEAMNEGDTRMLYWVAVWGILKRALAEGVVQCDSLALGWAEASFRSAGASTNPAPTGHGLNALRRVTSGWGPLPLSTASKPTDGDYNSVVRDLGLVVDAYLHPDGPYYLGPNRWIPPALGAAKKR